MATAEFFNLDRLIGEHSQRVKKGGSVYAHDDFLERQRVASEELLRWSEHTGTPLDLAVAMRLWADLQTLLHTMDYRLYLQTDHWARTRHYALDRAGRRCELCHEADEILNVHHKTYERRGFELPEDLIVLCRQCHAKFHNKLP
jgi:hypothetical protein